MNRFTPFLLLLSLPGLAAEYDFSGELGTEFTVLDDGAHQFMEKAGRAIYHNGETTGAGDRERLVWNSLHPRADSSWSLSVDVSIPLLAAREIIVGGVDPEIYAKMGIACTVGGHNFSAGLQQGFLGNSFNRVVISETELDGEELFDPAPDVDGIGELLTQSETVRVTIRHDAATHTLSTWVDGTELFSVDIDDDDSSSGSSNQTDWAMSASSTFNLVIGGSSENYPVTALRPLQLDNLHFAFADEPPPELALSIHPAFELEIKGDIHEAPAEIQASTDLSDWFTIRTQAGPAKLYFPQEKEGQVFYRAVREDS